MIPMSFIGAVLGVKSVLLIDQSFLGPVVMVLILFVGIYTIFSKSLGKVNQYSGATRKSAAAGMLSCLRSASMTASSVPAQAHS